jgi:hypothetical protein
MEVPRQYWRAWPGIRDRFSPANRAVEACLACPRVPSRAQADVPVSYPRVRCPFVKQRISSVEFFDTQTGMCVSAARADLVGDPYRLRLYAPDRSAGTLATSPKTAGQSGLEHFNRMRIDGRLVARLVDGVQRPVGDEARPDPPSGPPCRFLDLISPAAPSPQLADASADIDVDGRGP